MTARSVSLSCFVRFALVLGVLGVFCERVEAAEPEVLVAFYEVTGDSESLTKAFSQASSRSNSRSGSSISPLKGIRKLFSSKKRAGAESDMDRTAVGFVTDNQAQWLFRKLKKKKLRILSPPSEPISSGETKILNDSAVRYACTVTTSNDGEDIGLEVFLPQKDLKDDFPHGEKSWRTIMIYNDDYSVFFQLPPWPGQDEDRLIFIHAQVLEENS